MHVWPVQGRSGRAKSPTRSAANRSGARRCSSSASSSLAIPRAMPATSTSDRRVQADAARDTRRECRGSCHQNKTAGTGLGFRPVTIFPKRLSAFEQRIGGSGSEGTGQPIVSHRTAAIAAGGGGPDRRPGSHEHERAEDSVRAILEESSGIYLLGFRSVFEDRWAFSSSHRESEPARRPGTARARATTRRASRARSRRRRWRRRWKQSRAACCRNAACR